MSVKTRIILAIVCLVAIVGGLAAFNYWGVDHDKLPVERCIVTRVYQRTEYRTRRVTRYVTMRTDPHQVSYLEVERPNGEREDLRVDYSLYHRARRGDTLLLRIGPGRLGFEIIDRTSPRLIKRHR